MSGTSARLLKLLAMLQVPRDWTGPELAERLEVTTRTVRKDVQRLRELGYPVLGLPGAAGGYRLRPGTELPPLLLDDEEAVAVTLGLQSTAAGSVSGVEETSLRALNKIAALLPPRLRHRVQTLQGSSVLVPRPGPRVDAEVLQSLAQSCRGHEGVRFDYLDAAGGSSRRRAEPYQLVHRAGRWYLVSFDLDRSAWRSFRVDRMRLRTPGGARFTPRPLPGGDAAAMVETGVRAASQRCFATVRLHAPYEEVAAWLQPWWGRLEEADADTCLLHTAGDSYESIALGLGLSGLDFEVLDPPELRDQLRALADRLGRAAGAVADEPGSPSA